MNRIYMEVAGNVIHFLAQREDAVYQARISTHNTRSLFESVYLHYGWLVVDRATGTYHDAQGVVPSVSVVTLLEKERPRSPLTKVHDLAKQANEFARTYELLTTKLQQREAQIEAVITLAKEHIDTPLGAKILHAVIQAHQPPPPPQHRLKAAQCTYLRESGWSSLDDGTWAHMDGTHLTHDEAVLVQDGRDKGSG